VKKIIVGRGTWYKKVAKILGPDWTTTPSVQECRSAPVVVNFGMVGKKWASFLMDVVPLLPQDCKAINFNIEPNKYKVCKMVEDHIAVPPTMLDNDVDEFNKYIIKPFYSIGGKGICVWDGSEIAEDEHKYLQLRVLNRKYELRVHAFDWIPPSEYPVFKRTHPMGEQQLTWNHKQGGVFSSLKEPSVGVFKRAQLAAHKALKILGQNFGAVDFIVSSNDDPLVPWFIEVNSSPGMKIPGVRQAYVSAFNGL
jgi:hypothetical protein